MLTMHPRVSTRCGIAKRQVKNAPLRFVSRTLSYSASVVSLVGPSVQTPAALTTTSKRPCRAIVSAIMRSQSATIETFATMSPLRRSADTQTSPAASNLALIALPMPPSPPVTSTTRLDAGSAIAS
eukprot:Amastigsp_a344385_10.p4 type:complete len:126 gc:universal Amastigsp_a344385_10:393-16(-)